MQEDPAGGRLHQPRAGVESGGLPGAVRTDQPGDCTDGGRQAEVGDRQTPPKRTVRPSILRPSVSLTRRLPLDRLASVSVACAANGSFLAGLG